MSVEREDQENGYGSDKAPEDPPPEENKLFVGGISWHMLDRELKDGELATVSLCKPWRVLPCQSEALPFALQSSGNSDPAKPVSWWTG